MRHPGEILLEEYMKPIGLTEEDMASHLGLTVSILRKIVSGKLPVKADTALRLSACFGHSPEYWMRVQTTYDLEQAAEDPKLQNALLSVRRLY